ncbi:hypothetical protein O181_110466 [Austropuccinia psidii MF-1]|uniref:J domain-containing protein n=1 Tax=Austropuccinia psidii MF-1 TaxID=1389203 RepID=A0A9Q3JYN7_9BASI|nr:hypothetical protein [Austropuccinia psidii MF-1]
MAIELYSKALSFYPIHPFPNQSHHPQYSTTLANRAASHMALGDFKIAISDLENSLKSIWIPPLLTSELKNTLIKRLFRLIRCHLSLFDHQAALSSLQHLFSPNSPIFIPSDHPSFNQASLLLSKSNFLLESHQKLSQAQIIQDWNLILDIIQKLQLETLNWSLNSKPILKLPGLWSFWKAEALCHLGKPLEAQETIASTKSTFPTRERSLIDAWISFAKGDLSHTTKILDSILLVEPNDIILHQKSLFIKQLIQNMNQILNHSSILPLEVIELAMNFLNLLTAPITSTLRIRLYSFICQQLHMAILLQPQLESYFCNQLINLSDAILSTEIGFSSTSPMSTYPIHQTFVIEILMARARATHKIIPDLSSQTYTLIFKLLQDHWTEIKVDQEKIFQEIFQKVGLRKPSSTSESSETLKNHDFVEFDKLPDWDLKGYYHILGLPKNALLKDIKKSFRKLSLAHHPDKGGKTSLFQAINEANAILSDPALRKVYDEGKLEQ